MKRLVGILLFISIILGSELEARGGRSGHGGYRGGYGHCGGYRRGSSWGRSFGGSFLGSALGATFGTILYDSYGRPYRRDAYGRIHYLEDRVDDLEYENRRLRNKLYYR